MKSFMSGWLLLLLLLAAPFKVSAQTQEQAHSQVSTPQQLPLMPYPASVQQQPGQLRLPHRGNQLQLQLVAPLPVAADYLLQHLQQRLSAQIKVPAQIEPISPPRATAQPARSPC